MDDGKSFLIEPDLMLLLWTFLVLVLPVGALVTIAKGRLGWFLLGLVTSGIIWPLTALLIAAPDSAWARRFYGPEKMRRAMAAFPTRVPHPDARALREAQAA
jgi:hypothetical protein